MEERAPSTRFPRTYPKSKGPKYDILPRKIRTRKAKLEEQLASKRGTRQTTLDEFFKKLAREPDLSTYSTQLESLAESGSSRRLRESGKFYNSIKSVIKGLKDTLIAPQVINTIHHTLLHNPELYNVSVDFGSQPIADSEDFNELVMRFFEENPDAIVYKPEDIQPLTNIMNQQQVRNAVDQGLQSVQKSLVRLVHPKVLKGVVPVEFDRLSSALRQEGVYQTIVQVLDPGVTQIVDAITWRQMNNAGSRIKRINIAFVAPVDVYYDKITESEFLQVRAARDTLNNANGTQLPATYERFLNRVPYMKEQDAVVNFSFSGLSTSDSFLLGTIGEYVNVSIEVEFQIFFEYPRTSTKSLNARKAKEKNPVRIQYKQSKPKYKTKKTYRKKRGSKRYRK